jgi:hypothetical protein
LLGMILMARTSKVKALSIDDYESINHGRTQRVGRRGGGAWPPQKFEKIFDYPSCYTSSIWHALEGRPIR